MSLLQSKQDWYIEQEKQILDIPESINPYNKAFRFFAIYKKAI